MHRLILWLLIVCLAISGTLSSDYSYEDESDDYDSEMLKKESSDYDLEKPQQNRAACVICMPYTLLCGPNQSKCIVGWEKCIERDKNMECHLVNPKREEEIVLEYKYSVCDYEGFPKTKCGFREMCSLHTPCPDDRPTHPPSIWEYDMTSTTTKRPRI